MSAESRLRAYRYQGAKFLCGGANEQLLAEAQQSLRRELTDDEITAQVLELIETTGESLILEYVRPKNYRPGISGSSQILLPNGTYALLKSIGPGQKILSIDIVTGDKVVNEITGINKYWISEWRQYTDENLVSISASAHQLWFDYIINHLYKTIKLTTMDDERWGYVYGLAFDAGRSKELKAKSVVLAVRQSRFYNRQTMYSLTLAHAPHTFVANHYILPDDELCRQALEI